MPDDFPEPSLPLFPPEEARVGVFENLRAFATNPVEPGILE